MQVQKRRWQAVTIVIVTLLTIFNILPTLFFYSQPLRSPIDADRAEMIAQQIGARVDNMQPDAEAWLRSYITLLNIEATVASPDWDSRALIITAKTPQQLDTLKANLPYAGAVVPFVPAQLTLGPAADEQNSVIVTRALGTNFQALNAGAMRFGPIFEGDTLSPLAAQTLLPRLESIILALTGPTEEAQLLQAAATSNDYVMTPALQIAQSLVLAERINPPEQRSMVIRGIFRGAENVVAQLNALLERAIAELNQNLAKEDEPAAIIASNKIQLNLLHQAQAIATRRQTDLEQPLLAWDATQVQQLIAAAEATQQGQHRISLNEHSALFEAVVVDWRNGTLQLLPSHTAMQDSTRQLLVGAVAYAQRQSREELRQQGDRFVVSLYDLPGATSVLAIDLAAVGDQALEQLGNFIRHNWSPSHSDLQPDSFAIWTEKQYQETAPGARRLGLVLVNPLTSGKGEGKLNPDSLYVIVKGAQTLFNQYNSEDQRDQAKLLQEDFRRLIDLLASHGFFQAQAGMLTELPGDLSKDLIFEDSRAYATPLAATRERFQIRGDRRFAVLQMSDVEQRILTLNRIETEEQEDLLRWRDAYTAAQVNLDPQQRYSVPAPTHNAFLSNLALSARKYVRGDERKILRWGLDLSGGKSVRLELRDATGGVVRNADELAQGVQELQQRVNRMGVSETSIRLEGETIAIDFPGQQSLSAEQLIQGSSMAFHIVNEQFSGVASPYRQATQRFLQDVWNEAVVTGKTDLRSLNLIARSLLGQADDEQLGLIARSPAAAALVEAGLEIADPNQPPSAALDDRVSMVVPLRGDSPADWMGSPQPLLLVFRNFALEGTQLRDIHAAYDQTRGNYLAFGVQTRSTDREGTRIDPAENFYQWTLRFSPKGLEQGNKLAVSGGRGWRMAVVLNGSIISAPALEDALRDSAMISGSFSQREVNRLAADLKAGSLSYTPQILSETNVSPELGAEERFRGVLSTGIAFIAVIALMLFVYRRAGAVAGVALLGNLLIIWAVLQNIQATLTLAGIAGIVLTLGMAVDANVLVFERIREELRAGARLMHAIASGYKKSFSAIFDSNLTTILAGIILLNFDAGPLKGFAITLIIGVASSMFTALFATRAYFSWWVQRPGAKQLSMWKHLIATRWNFLRWSRTAMVSASLLIVVGLGLLIPQRHTILGMDFTGGYSVQVELAKQPSELSPRKAILDRFIAQGLASGDVQVRELDRPEQLSIQLSAGLDEAGKPFAGLPLRDVNASGMQSNPRLAWVVDQIEGAGWQIAENSSEQLATSWTSMSGQYSQSMRTNALTALLLAIASVLLYLSIRFEWRYAIAAIVCLAHDILITLAFVSILAMLGLPLRLDMQMIAALMTILGYSLNDTIIIFDRIREDVAKGSRLSFSALANHALNETLSRTVMTSGTTILVVAILLLMGGAAIFNFSLALLIGILMGTISSWLIATPVLCWLEARSGGRQVSAKALSSETTT